MCNKSDLGADLSALLIYLSGSNIDPHLSNISKSGTFKAGANSGPVCGTEAVYLTFDLAFTQLSRL